MSIKISRSFPFSTQENGMANDYKSTYLRYINSWIFKNKYQINLPLPSNQTSKNLASMVKK